ncbi:mitotic spindle checkpoint protein MAD1 [Abeliophyllum distichum]|uniref:Mitotic spindle checkpoint protein MAD1 n=1 Tax=Abeliophyllum distichum TaxID=126358 RepID=A0ABD1RIA1_9LAMI
MILRTPPARKRRAEFWPSEDNNTNNPGSNRQHLVIYEDHQELESLYDHSIPIITYQMLCTYQCRQMLTLNIYNFQPMKKRKHTPKSEPEHNVLKCNRLQWFTSSSLQRR